MGRCEVCLGRVEKTCGYDDEPVDFCTKHYIEHLEHGHPQNKGAQREAKELRARTKGKEGE